ncbi:MAG: cytochrome C assembly protein [Candidatus Methanoperedens sp.]|nr:cytochrome C assembly protein [Candidatus Methanoperedens sp.]
MLRRLFFIILWAIVTAGMYMALVVSPPAAVLGDSYRIFFFHLPNAVLAFFSFTVTAVSGIMYLRTKNIAWDYTGSGSVKLGFVFGGLALATGWAFSYEAWGTRWSWDPKVVATFVMWFVYIGYIMLRRSVDDETRKARLCAVYAIVGYVSVPLAYLSSRLAYSLHPESIGLTEIMKMTAVIMVAGFFLLYLYLLWFQTRLARLLRLQGLET